MPSASNNMNTKSKKEIDAYFKRVEDPTNYSSERWWYLINSWNDHIYRIMLEKKWVDDDSTYYKMLIEQLKNIFVPNIWHDIKIFPYSKKIIVMGRDKNNKIQYRIL